MRLPSRVKQLKREEVLRGDSLKRLHPSIQEDGVGNLTLYPKACMAAGITYFDSKSISRGKQLVS